MKIIDNKKIDMTEDEWSLYGEICRSYDRPSFKGEELFRNLFETDNNGMIIFLKPPANRHTSMEVIIFLINVMAHQHLRAMQKEASAMFSQMKEKINELDKILEEKRIS
jgi:hypothetical protein